MAGSGFLVAQRPSYAPLETANWSDAWTGRPMQHGGSSWRKNFGGDAIVTHYYTDGARKLPRVRT
jgi:hypothetical protein